MHKIEWFSKDKIQKSKWNSMILTIEDYIGSDRFLSSIIKLGSSNLSATEKKVETRTLEAQGTITCLRRRYS